MTTTTSPAPPAPRERSRTSADAARSARRRRSAAQWLFIAPAVLYMLAFFGYPLIRNVTMSFQDYSVATYFTGEAPFAGLDNWRAVFADELFGASLWHTLLFTLGSLAGQFTIGMGLALFFSRRFPLSGVLRSLLLLPWLIPMVVAGTVWRRVLDEETGVANEILRGLQLTSANIPWLSSPDAALVSVILVNIWIGIPFNMVILYGGLQEIPAEVREAAVIDGAGPVRAFFGVTLPMLRPVVTVVLVLGFMSTVKILDLILALTNGGPAHATETLGTHTYQLSFLQLDFGQGAVVGNVLILVSMVFAVIYLRANRDGFTEGR
ncbi:carbohydrate ABC transporter permease [Nocardiopsis sediminis]|uniref:Carbohydrate ABC transporter permease n=1 Tax=Nocardiopsis sediminis TaxID=1778267 RepID=A0ABV8FTM9_9ACTN